MKTHENKTCLLFVYHPTTTIVLQQLPSWNNYHLAHTIIYKLEKRPTTAYRPPIATTYRLQHLQTFLYLMPTIYTTFRPFMVVAYHLQQCYLPYKPQISYLPPCCYLLMATIVLWQKAFSTLKTKNKERISYCSYKFL